eukprot:CAMPEP_0184340876 /NCGR_PEP_ID=MMETSP1089-20130417/9515_1 /TAXON_ID=38269 ORGANISM="Gloeochaete wittrockiana, Strain SAG46.84" /NCGR_SAMPLE_ID=MMETSP1089 /ASSEMBLY_ACC=CAM_ASM_000445 /LENGTH=282 /DNA_ID=CAMNT_0026668891 /DNA_START=230 /DNA_END=1078 /DNA_ORIENTATION=+
MARFVLVALKLAVIAIAFESVFALFQFSTGNPDGRFASNIQIDGPEWESADDFAVCTPKDLASGSVYVLLPKKVNPLIHIAQAHFEIYRIFPNDSAPFDGKVPSRTNSPSDVDLSPMARDTASGNLRVFPRLVKTSYSVSNSVFRRMFKLPANVTTGGDGPLTGSLYEFNFVFKNPVSLPVGRFFAVFQLKYTSAGASLATFPPLAVSAAGPTPGTGDLQSWGRKRGSTATTNIFNDWERFGTDVVGGGVKYNIAFSLTGCISTDASVPPAKGGQTAALRTC